MPTIGQLPFYWGKGCDWQVFTERLESFFNVNNVPDDKKTATLIAATCDEIYKTVRDVCHPRLPTDIPYTELLSLLNKQFIVRTSVFLVRDKFYRARQEQSESISEWHARLNDLSTDCKFEDQLDAIRLDRFICGLSNKAVLDRLCEEKEPLTIQTALEIATARESSLANEEETIAKTN